MNVQCRYKALKTLKYKCPNNINFPCYKRNDSAIPYDQNQPKNVKYKIICKIITLPLPILLLIGYALLTLNDFFIKKIN